MLDKLSTLIKFMFLYEKNNPLFHSLKYCDYVSTSDGTRTLYDKDGNTFCSILIDRNDTKHTLDETNLTDYRIVVRDQEIFLCSPLDNMLDKLCVLDYNSTDVVDNINIPSTESLEEALFQISTLHDSNVITALQLYFMTKEYIGERMYICLDMSIIDSDKFINKVISCLPKIGLEYDQN